MDQYQEKDYTASSWKKFEKVYNDVKAALENENTSDDVQALTNTLKEAAQKLVKRGNLDGRKFIRNDTRRSRCPCK